MCTGSAAPCLAGKTPAGDIRPHRSRPRAGFRVGVVWHARCSTRPRTMRACQWLRRLLWQGARQAHRAARALGLAGRGLAERLAYRPREVVVVAILAGGLFGGLAVERWRTRHPAIAERLEAEPPRLTSSAVAHPVPRPRPRGAAARCEEPSRATTRLSRQAGDSGSAQTRLDLNRATPGELARLAGISWGLAARIIAAREAFEGRDSSIQLEPLGRERFTWSRRRLPAPAGARFEPEADGPAPVETPPAADAPEPESFEGTSEAAPR